MNKTELIRAIALDADITQAVAERALNGFINATRTEVKAGGDVKLVGFGKFSHTQRKARQVRNPKTGDMMTVPSKVTITFKAGKDIKEFLNE